MSRDSLGNLLEVQLPIEMPGYRGAGSEFFINKNLPHFDSKIIQLDKITQDTILLGYVFGGILSPTINPFANNVTNTTSADNSIYKVYLIKNTLQNVFEIDGTNPYQVDIFPNPVKDELNVQINNYKAQAADYFITDTQGKILQEGEMKNLAVGLSVKNIKLKNIKANQTLFITFVFEDKYYVTKKVIKQ